MNIKEIIDIVDVHSKSVNDTVSAELALRYLENVLGIDDMTALYAIKILTERDCIERHRKSIVLLEAEMTAHLEARRGTLN